MNEDSVLKPTVSIRDRIEKGIITDHADGTVQNQVVEAFVHRETSRRVDLLVKGFDELAKLAKAYDDINKPDNTFFTPDGTLALVSQKRKKEQEAALKKATKLSVAIDNAFLNADYAGLEKALKGGGDKNQNDSED